MKIRKLLDLKGDTVVKVRPDDTISKAAHLMKLHHPAAWWSAKTASM